MPRNLCGGKATNDTLHGAARSRMVALPFGPRKEPSSLGHHNQSRAKGDTLAIVQKFAIYRRSKVCTLRVGLQPPCVASLVPGISLSTNSIL